MSNGIATIGGSLALATDLYQLTMAYAHWKTGTAEHEAVFHLVFRNCPFGGGYAIACGLGLAVDYLRGLRFEAEDRQYLAGLTGSDGRPLFDPAFLDFLGRAEFVCDVDAIPEGTAVFPQEPLLRVSGPVWQSQIVETALLTLVNFSTLIATKAARVCDAAEGEPVIEFGLRRAQGLDGGLTASRAAFIGGCDSTSNVLAGKRYGIPVRGTHAHSWVMFHEDERSAFRQYAAALPNHCLFLVDTYDTLSGVRNALAIGRELRDAQPPSELAGIRLDSGDLAALSRAAREELDAAGWPHARIVASSDLDEHEIVRLKRAGARIDVWGVGTRLATAYDQPALGGVYKLSAVRAPNGDWQPRMKLSNEPAKSSNPGRLQVRRFSDPAGRFLGDILYEIDLGLSSPPSSQTPTGPFAPSPTAVSEDLLVPVFRGGKLVYDLPSLTASRARTREQHARLDGAVTRFDDPQTFPVGLDARLLEAKERLSREIRGQ